MSYHTGCACTMCRNLRKRKRRAKFWKVVEVLWFVFIIVLAIVSVGLTVR